MDTHDRSLANAIVVMVITGLILTPIYLFMEHKSSGDFSVDPAFTLDFSKMDQS